MKEHIVEFHQDKIDEISKLPGFIEKWDYSKEEHATTSIREWGKVVIDNVTIRYLCYSHTPGMV